MRGCPSRVAALFLITPRHHCNDNNKYSFEDLFFPSLFSRLQAITRSQLETLKTTKEKQSITPL